MRKQVLLAEGEDITPQLMLIDGVGPERKRMLIRNLISALSYGKSRPDYAPLLMAADEVNGRILRGAAQVLLADGAKAFQDLSQAKDDDAMEAVAQIFCAAIRTQRNLIPLVIAVVRTRHETQWLTNKEASLYFHTLRPLMEEEPGQKASIENLLCTFMAYDETLDIYDGK